MSRIGIFDVICGHCEREWGNHTGFRCPSDEENIDNFYPLSEEDEKSIDKHLIKHGEKPIYNKLSYYVKRKSVKLKESFKELKETKEEIVVGSRLSSIGE